MIKTNEEKIEELDDVEKKVIEVIQGESDVEGIYLSDHTKEDLGLDSLDMLEVIMSLEDAYSVDFEKHQDDYIYSGCKVKEIVDIVKENLERKIS